MKPRKKPSRRFRFVGGTLDGKYKELAWTRFSEIIDIPVATPQTLRFDPREPADYTIPPTYTAQRYRLHQYFYFIDHYRLRALLYVLEGLDPDGRQVRTAVDQIRLARHVNYTRRKQRNRREWKQSLKWIVRYRKWKSKCNQRGPTWAAKHPNTFVEKVMAKFYAGSHI